MFHVKEPVLIYFTGSTYSKVQNMVQLEGAALTRDAVATLSVGKTRQAREQTAKGFFVYGLMLGHFRDIASAFAVYGFTPAMRFDTLDFNKKFFAQYNGLYDITVKGDKNAPQSKERSDIWELLKKSFTIDMKLHDDSRVKESELRALQKFDSANAAVHNVNCARPAAVPILVLCTYAKLMEGFYNKKPEDRIDPETLMMAQFEGTTSASDKSRDKNIKFKGHNNAFTLSVMDRKPGVTEPRTLMEFFYVVFGSNFRASLGKSERKKHDEKQRKWYNVLESAKKNDGYSLDVDGTIREGTSDEEDDDEPAEKATTTRTQTLKEAAFWMTYFETIIRIDPRVPHYMKDEINGIKFLPFFRRLTEVRKVKRGKNKAAAEDYVITGPSEEFLMCSSTVGEEVRQAVDDYFQKTRTLDVTAKRGNNDLYVNESQDEEDSEVEKGDNSDGNSSSDEVQHSGKEVDEIESEGLYETSSSEEESEDESGSDIDSDESRSGDSDSSGNGEDE